MSRRVSRDRGSFISARSYQIQVLDVQGSNPADPRPLVGIPVARPWGLAAVGDHLKSGRDTLVLNEVECPGRQPDTERRRRARVHHKVGFASVAGAADHEGAPALHRQIACNGHGYMAIRVDSDGSVETIVTAG